ncbi:MAG: tetratricopeptide repeat protein [Bacteroidetes bacterium]|nr:tetratricopeptide repeat protein [Bacteroidota bacterium]
MSIKSRIESLKDFLQMEPNDAFTLYALALEYAREDNLNESQNYFTQLLHRHPGYLAAYYHLGKLYERLNNSVEAGSIYMAGIKLAERLNNNHARTELNSAYKELTGIDESDL